MVRSCRTYRKELATATAISGSLSTTNETMSFYCAIHATWPDNEHGQGRLEGDTNKSLGLRCLDRLQRVWYGLTERLHVLPHEWMDLDGRIFALASTDMLVTGDFFGITGGVEEIFYI